MNSKTYAIIAILCAGGLFAYFWLQSTGPGPYDDFARCITEKGFSMAGTNTCPSCQQQKRLFGSSFQYIDFHDCESDRGWCSQRGIKYYPAWIMPDGQKITGVSSLKYLSDLSNCSLEKSTACANCSAEQSNFCSVEYNSTSCANTTSTIPSPSEQRPGLVAHWSFDEEGSSTIKDSVDNLEGRIYGGAKFEKGKRGNALYFDGVDDFIQLSDESFSRVSNLSYGTIAFWFKFQSVLDKQSIMPIFYLGMEDEKDEDNILIIEVGHFKQGNLRTQDPDNKRLYSTFIKDGGHPFLCLDSGRSMEENEWTHYALVSGPNGTNVFINGAGIPANYNFGGLGDAYFLNDIPDTQVIMLGRGKTSSMATYDFVYYKGYLDELRIYDKPLTKEEIQKLL